MNTSLRQFARRSKAIIVAYKIYQNWCVKRRLRSGICEATLGSTHIRLGLAESLRYIETQFNDYLEYGSLSRDSIRDITVLEAGFGDNVGVALKFVAAGAARAICVDKFWSLQDGAQQRQIYLALRETLSSEERRRFDKAIDLTREIYFNPEHIRCIHGIGVEDLAIVVAAESVDLIISRAVLQDVYEPGPAFDAMESVLAPGGSMLHKIDLSDQGMFRDNGMHPLTFLTIPRSVYRLMAADCGNSNRMRLSDYERELSRLGYEGRAFVTHMIGDGERRESAISDERADKDVDERARLLVEQIRPSLAREFSQSSDEDLTVDGIFLVAQKPFRGRVHESSVEAMPFQITSRVANSDRPLEASLFVDPTSIGGRGSLRPQPDENTNASVR